MGARGRPRCHAKAPGSKARSDEGSETHRGAHLWHAQTLDGIGTFPHEDSGQGPHRDEFARSRIQPEARYADTRHCGDDASDKDGGSVSAICARQGSRIAVEAQVMDEADE